jgi:hypothetical protein
MRRRMYEECQRNEGKMVSNYETKLKTEYEGYLGATLLRLERIVGVQM